MFFCSNTFQYSEVYSGVPISYMGSNIGCLIFNSVAFVWPTKYIAMYCHMVSKFCYLLQHFQFVIQHLSYLSGVFAHVSFMA
jgi:hypothetical protein